MSGIKAEIETFLATRASDQRLAAQRVALQLLCGLDMDELLSADTAAQRLALARIERMMARERRRGLAGHWSYDLNRHIALQQAALRLRESLEIDPPERREAGWRERRALQPDTTVTVLAADAPSDDPPHRDHVRPGRDSRSGSTRPAVDMGRF